MRQLLLLLSIGAVLAWTQMGRTADQVVVVHDAQTQAARAHSLDPRAAGARSPRTEIAVERGDENRQVVDWILSR